MIPFLRGCVSMVLVVLAGCAANQAEPLTPLAPSASVAPGAPCVTGFGSYPHGHIVCSVCDAKPGFPVKREVTYCRNGNLLDKLSRCEVGTESCQRTGPACYLWGKYWWVGETACVAVGQNPRNGKFYYAFMTCDGPNSPNQGENVGYDTTRCAGLPIIKPH